MYVFMYGPRLSRVEVGFEEKTVICLAHERYNLDFLVTVDNTEWGYYSTIKLIGGCYILFLRIVIIYYPNNISSETNRNDQGETYITSIRIQFKFTGKMYDSSVLHTGT